MTTSRLPTLQEEETSNLKAPEPVRAVREEADGKDEAAEVNTQIRTDSQNQTSFSSFLHPPLPPGPGHLQPVAAPVVSGHHQQLPRGQGHQLQHIVEKWPGLLCHPTSLSSRENVRRAPQPSALSLSATYFFLFAVRSC